MSSSEEYWQPMPSLQSPPNTPFLPFFIGNKGNLIHSYKKIDGVSAAVKLAKEIAYDLQNPNVITGEDTLTKFNILTRVIRVLSASQIQQISEKLYYPAEKANPQSESESYKYRAWVAFRDAVAQAGTGPALVTIQQWIKNYQITGERAAQLLAVLPKTARYPTLEYMNYFFVSILLLTLYL